MEGSTTSEYYEQLKKAAQFVKENLGTAEIALVLGSGLNSFTNELKNKTELRYDEIPFMPQTSVKGHQGKLVRGQVDGKWILCLAGRIHGYEGAHMYTLNFAARMMAFVGCKLFIATNAAGGSQPDMYPGALMMIKDHINFFKRNPIADTFYHRGISKEKVDSSKFYSVRVQTIAKKVAEKINVKLFEGTYGATSGPCYETPSEVQAFSKLGASAFGMSTVPEVVAANAIGMEVFAVSMITNLAAGITDEVLTHSAVTDIAQSTGPTFVKFIRELIREVNVVDVQIQPENFTVNSTPFPLPAPTAKPASIKQVKQADEFLRKHLQPNTEVAIALAREHQNFLDEIQQLKKIPFSEIPNFPLVNPQPGVIFTGRAKEISVVGVSFKSADGPACEEATFLAELFSRIGVKLLLHTFVVGAFGNCSDNFVLLDDCVDFSTIHPIPQSIHHTQYPVDVTPFSESFISQLKSKIGIQKSGTYGSFQGPTFPTPAEISIAEKAGWDFYGMNSLALVYACRSCNAEVIGVAQVVDHEVTENQTSRILHNTLANVELLKDIKSPTFADPHPFQITYYLPSPIGGGDYDEVHRTKKNVGWTVDSQTAIVIDFEMLEAVRSKIEIKKEHKDSRCHIAHGSLAQKSFWLILGSFKENQGYPFETITFSVRLLHAFGVKSIVFFSEMCSVSSDLPLGSFVTARDHIMLSGRNPLFGPNEDRWGVRFPDLSQAYDPTLRTILLDSAKKMNLTIRETIYAHLIGPIFGSKADMEFASFLGAETICTGIAPEICVARHMGVKTAVVGFINSKLPSRKSEGSNQALGKHQIAETILRLISELI